MTKIFCDKCGKEVTGSSLAQEIVFSESGKNFCHTKKSLNIYMYWNYRNAKGLNVETPDICLDCTKQYMIQALKKWGVL